MSERLKVFIEKGPKSYLKIVDEVGNKGNEGMICLSHGHIWFKAREKKQKDGRKKNARYLIGEIEEAGGDVCGDNNFSTLEPGKKPRGIGGSGYLGGLSFPEAEGKKKPEEIVAPAIEFLKQYYRVFLELD